MTSNATLLFVRILSRYFAWRFLGLFAAVLAVSTLTIIVVEMLLNLEDMLRLQPGLPGVLHYLFLRIPSYYLRELLPIASFTACFFTLGISSRWLEITALKSGGVSVGRILMPILVVATLLGGLSFALGETWIVGSTREWNRTTREGQPDVSYRQGSFWYNRGRTIYNISGADPETQTLRGVRIFERNRQGRLLRSITSQDVRVVDEGSWHFRDAVIHRYAPDVPEAPPDFELVDEIVLEVGGIGDVELIDTDLQSLRLSQLLDYMQMRVAEGEAVHRIMSVLQARIMEPMNLVLFALLAAPLGLKVEQWRGFGWPALLGIITVGSYFTLRAIADTLTSEAIVSSTVANASLLIGFASAGTWGLIRSRG